MASLKNLRRRIVFTCSDVNEFLTAYADGVLERGMRRRFDRHVAACPGCATYLGQYRQTVELVRDAGNEPVPNPPDELVALTLAFLRDHYEE